ncbi:hypothetical protein JIG36_12570 [Actinoplanes sp. LDG1-06]|uniref:Nitroreductase n=1 Tax=Paractinoplanes ovalisporus TaxID=2810368 RepID=A0ABS2A980_9ACTN|nr:hypothetical protein [Actinoplanes ovalisporus]MBM2616391.1 hypothetical protein [Actinoplanes ovalisporus]
MTPLERAAEAARHAPSIFNTQPWLWRVDATAMELYDDPRRRVTGVDRDSRLMLLSCGAALHHARVWLSGNGWPASVERRPDPDRPGLLARLTLGEPALPDSEAARMARVIPYRHTDRRPFGDRMVSDTEMTRLRRLVEAEGAYLHTVRRDQVAALAFATGAAARAELNNPDYRSELRIWTHRPGSQGDGITSATAVGPGPRTVPIRDFYPAGPDPAPPSPRRELRDIVTVVT